MKTNEQKKLNITLKNLRIFRENWAKQIFNPKMMSFGGISYQPLKKLHLEQTNECGTNCCALGKAPEFPGLEIQKEDFNEFGVFVYLYYADRIFPYFFHSFQDYESPISWSFLFGARWPNDRQKLLERVDIAITELGNLEALQTKPKKPCKTQKTR